MLGARKKGEGDSFYQGWKVGVNLGLIRHNDTMIIQLGGLACLFGDWKLSKIDFILNHFLY